MNELAPPGTGPYAALIAMQRVASRLGGDFQSVSRCVAEGARRIVASAERVAIGRIEGGALICPAANDPGRPGLHLRLSGWAPDAPFLIEDSRIDARIDVAACREHAIRSVLVVAIPRRDFGVLAMMSAEPLAFDADDVALAQLLAGMLPAPALSTDAPQGGADRVELLDIDGRIESISYDLSGSGSDTDLIGMPWLDRWERSCQDVVTAAIKQARAGGIGRFSAAGAGGERRWWDVRLSPLAVSGSMPPSLLAVSRDVTALHDATERAELAIEAGSVIGLGIWEPGFCSIDDRLAAALGLPAAAPRPDRTPSELLACVHPQDHEALRVLARKVRRDGGKLRVPFRLRHGQGWR